MADKISPSAYLELLDLSTRFLQAADMCILPGIKLAHNPLDLNSGRIGYIEQAAMTVWAGSYFMGVFSQAGLPAGNDPFDNIKFITQKDI